MKKGNLDQWKNISACKNLLFFSQLVNELLFDYSIPSNRVSTLNSHYLCLDALSAIESIEYHGVPEGTLKPIMEELYVALKKDPAFDNMALSPLNYFLKYQNDHYVLGSRVSDLAYNDLKKTASALHTIFFQDDQYYKLLKESIIQIVLENDTNKQKPLFRLVKSLLTELMNYGYSLRYIYEVMNRFFWSSSKTIEDPESIHEFFEAFPLTRNTYRVVFLVKKSKMGKFIDYVTGIDLNDELPVQIGTKDEKRFLHKKNTESFLPIEIEALDPFSAAKRAKEMLSINAALYRLFDHAYRYNINSVRCAVYDKDRFYKVAQAISPVAHTKALSAKRIAESMSISGKALDSISSNKAYDDLISILNAARFHSHSLDSASEENQLLDLWAIFESVLKISSKHTTDRIQQVCMYLVPILKRKYVYSLFEQLSADIKNYSEEIFASIVGSEPIEQEEMIRRLFALIVLDENKEARERLLLQCDDFPLLQERINYYAETLHSTELIYKFVEKHAERVRWQVMRIYRNRNLIVHNADTMPYLSLLIENLHSYVDEFLSHAIHSMAAGHDIESMCQDLFVKECQWNATFQRNNRSLNNELVEQVLAL